MYDKKYEDENSTYNCDFFFSILCLSFLYVTTQSGMTRLMKTSAKEKMKTSLNSQAALVDEYVAHQEDLLI